MPIDYDSVPGGLFTNIGTVIDAYHDQREDAQSLNEQVDLILELFNEANLGRVLGVFGLQNTASWRSQHVARRRSLAELVTRRLSDRYTVQEPLGINPASQAVAILESLAIRMVRDEETIQKSVASFSSQEVVTCVGSQRVLICPNLDGVSSPGRGMPAMPHNAGERTQLVSPSDTIRVTTTTDRYTGASAGSERYLVSGNEPDVQYGVSEIYGSGVIFETSHQGARNLINSSVGFESFSVSTGLPTGWTLSYGDAGVIEDFLLPEETEVYEGSRSLKLYGDGVQANIGVSLAINTLARPNRMYCVTARVWGSSSSGTFSILCEGTDYTAAPATIQKQDVQIGGATGGTYKISWNGNETDAVAYDATSATLQAALREIPGLECVTVATQAGSPPDVTHRITMAGVWGDPPLVTINTASLTTGTAITTAITKTTTGIAGEKVSLTPAQIPAEPSSGEWHLAHFFFLAPPLIPSDFKLTLKFAGPDNNDVVYIDNVFLSPVQYGGGFGLEIVNGLSPPQIGDQITFTVSNSEGYFQRGFREMYGIQMPSDDSPTIDDDLAHF